MSIVRLNMSPIFSSVYMAYGSLTDAIISGYFTLADAIGKFFSYGNNIRLGKFASACGFAFVRFLEFCIEGMLYVLRCAAPFKIAYAIIFFITVYVINLLKCIWVWRKCQSNQTMDIKCFPAGRPSTQTNRNVTTTSHRLLQNLPDALFAKCRNFIAVSMPVSNRFSVIGNPINRSNTPKIRNLISTFITNNWKPNFVHLKFSIKELSLLKSERQAGNESAFWGIPLSAQKDYTPCQS